MQKSLGPIAAACLVALLSAGSSAHAVTAGGKFYYVAPDGNDGNTCLSPAARCRQVATAVANAAPLGVIHVQPGEYAGFEVDQSVDVLVDGGYATINVAVSSPGGPAGIFVTAGLVNLRGFHLVAATGMVVTNAFVHARDFIIEPTKYGVELRPSSYGEVYIMDTVISGSGSEIAGGGEGVLVKPLSAGWGYANLVLDNVRVENNSSGITVDGRSGPENISATIRNSLFSGLENFAVFAVDSGSGSTTVTVEGSSFTRNRVGVVANGANATVRMRSSVVTDNQFGLSIMNAGKIISHGDNVNADNAIAQGAFTQTLAPQ